MKHFRKTIALFLVVVMLTITMMENRRPEILIGYVDHDPLQEMKIRDFRIRQKRPWIAGFWMELIQLVTIT